MLITIISVSLISIFVGVFYFARLLRLKVMRVYSYLYEVTDGSGIEELYYIKIGDVDQCIHVRGRDRSNPLLLFIHGGPGASQIGWYDNIQRPWEDHFTVVQWDQRQSGKSYAANLSKTISHQRYIQDTEEIIGYLRKEFSQEKIFIMGTSYGTYLGMHMVSRHPDWLYAYVAVGQVVTMIDHVEEEYKQLLNFAEDENNLELKAELAKFDPSKSSDDIPGFYIKNVLPLMEVESRCGKAYPKSILEMIRCISTLKWVSPLYSCSELLRIKFGEKAAAIDPKFPFFKDFFDYDLPREVGNTFDVPIFFLTGFHDIHVASDLTNSWFERIDAPYKEQVWFKKSAHAAYLTEPYAFANALIEKVLPFSQSLRGGGEKYDRK